MKINTGNRCDPISLKDQFFPPLKCLHVSGERIARSAVVYLNVVKFFRITKMHGISASYHNGFSDAEGVGQTDQPCSGMTDGSQIQLWSFRIQHRIIDPPANIQREEVSKHGRKLNSRNDLQIPAGSLPNRLQMTGYRVVIGQRHNFEILRRCIIDQFLYRKASVGFVCMIVKFCPDESAHSAAPFPSAPQTFSSYSVLSFTI